MNLQQQREYQLKREQNFQKYIFKGDQDEEDFLGHALILSFEHVDFPFWDKECPILEEAFESMRCSVITLYLDSPDFKDKLKKFVDKRFKKPKIIYISCHGSDRDGAEGLKFSSGGDRKVYAERSWSDIVEIFAPAKVDVLFIIDCCHAGKACISYQGTGIRYAKEVITVTSWQSDGYSMMLTPITAGMKCWFTNNLKTNLTARKLYEYINASVRYERDAAELWDKEYYTQPIFTQEHDDWVSEAIGSSKDGKIMSAKKARRWKLAMPKSELPTQETAMTKDVEKLFRLLNLNPESKDDSEEEILDKAPMENTKKLPCRRRNPEKERSYRTMRSQKILKLGGDLSEGDETD